MKPGQVKFQDCPGHSRTVGNYASGCRLCIGPVFVVTGASGCDQWVGSMGVVTVCGQWVVDLLFTS